MYKVTLIPGDGIGPEITEVARRCVEATGVDIKWEVVQAGESVMKKYGTPLPQEVIDSIRETKIAWKGPITTPVGGGFRSVNVALRKILNLYMCLRPYRYYPGVKSRFPEVDLVVIRENTEDLYMGVEFEEGKSETRKLIDFIYQTTSIKIREDSGISIKCISESATRKIVEAAFKYALENNRKKVTAVHKANIMKFSDGLFSRVAKEVAKSYQEKIEFEERLIDNMCMQLVQKPQNYDVLPTHGSAPKYKGQNKVNPTGMILSGVMMLRWLGEKEAADKLENAVAEVIKEGKNVTYDFKPTPDDPTAVGTREMGEAVIKKILYST